MAIQAILFIKKQITLYDKVMRFLKRNISEKIKPLQITNKYICAILIESNYKKHEYRKGSITKGIDCVFEF